MSKRRPSALIKHLLPNALSSILVRATMDVGYAILTTASLSFVGLGAQPPLPEWGAMVTAGRTYLLVQWWYATFPRLAIFVTVLGFVLLGDALQDWLDPGLRGQYARPRRLTSCKWVPSLSGQPCV